MSNSWNVQEPRSGSVGDCSDRDGRIFPGFNATSSAPESLNSLFAPYRTPIGGSRHISIGGCDVGRSRPQPVGPERKEGCVLYRQKTFCYGRWLTRYACLEGRHLEIYKSSMKRRLTHKVDVSECGVTKRDSIKDNCWSFSLTSTSGKRIATLGCTAIDERDKWVESIERMKDSLDTPSPLTRLSPFADVMAATYLPRTPTLGTPSVRNGETDSNMHNWIFGNPAAVEVGEELDPQHSIDFENDLVLGGQIGSGGLGVVYWGWFRGRAVACKLVAPHHYFGERGLEFINELRQELLLWLRAGSHENVTTCYGGSTTSPVVFIVTELMEQTLADYIRKEGRLPPSRACRILLDVLRGLQHLHTLQPKQVVHRDLKPENVLLDNSLTAKLTDFNVARLKDTSAYIRTRHNLNGTPDYLAPEVVDGKITEKMDIYSVGVLLWEMLTGMRPWSDFDELGADTRGLLVITRVAQKHRPGFPEDVFPTVAGEYPVMYELKQLIERCWEHDYRTRPTCQDLIRQVEHLQQRFPELR